MARYSNDVDNLRNQLQTKITKGLKDRIRELDLIDTGEMLRMTEAHIKFSNDGLDIKLESTDYYKYLDSDYNITNYVLEQNNVSELMDEVFGLMMMDILFED